jgi:hypothetical protein
MRKRSFVCLVVSLYDFCRFLLLSGVLALIAAPSKNNVETLTGIRLEAVPVPLFMAPLALFPIMAFFFWFDLDASLNSLRLYTAGKILSVVAAAAWIYHYPPPRAPLALILQGGSAGENLLKLFFAYVVPLLAVFDALSIALVQMRVKRRARAENAPAGPARGED